MSGKFRRQYERAVRRTMGKRAMFVVTRPLVARRTPAAARPADPDRDGEA